MIRRLCAGVVLFHAAVLGAQAQSEALLARNPADYASQKAYVLELIHHGKSQEAQSDYVTAMRLYARALEIWPNHDEARARYQHARAQESRQKSNSVTAQAPSGAFSSNPVASGRPNSGVASGSYFFPAEQTSPGLAQDQIYNQYLASKGRYRYVPESSAAYPTARAIAKTPARSGNRTLLKDPPASSNRNFFKDPPSSNHRTSQKNQPESSFGRALEAERRLQKKEEGKPAAGSESSEIALYQKELEEVKKRLQKQNEQTELILLILGGVVALQGIALLALIAVIVRQKKQLPSVQAEPYS